jgi:serine/threonine-protein kinase RsbW
MSLNRDAAMSADRASQDGQRFRMAAVVMPADKDYLALARLATMHVAGLLGLSVGRVIDLRLAVNEACVLLLGAPVRVLDEHRNGHGAGAKSELELNFDRGPGQLRITVRGPAPSCRPDPEDIGWLVLRALVDEVHLDTAGATATVTLTDSLPARREQ